MGSGFQFVDIIFFALVAAFIILRLRSVLGRRTGHEQRRDPFAKPQPGSKVPGQADAPADVTQRGDTQRGDVVQLPRRAGSDAVPASSPLAAALTQIKVADPSFDEAAFEKGARSAFEYIVTAFAAGDRDKLRPLLNDEVYANFESAIVAREAVGQKRETTLVRIKSAEIVEARMESPTALVTVKYASEQINATRNAAGDVVEGNPDRITDVVDIWTYARNTRSNDPNWTLVATDAPN
jgi:predicted lipid-binding transport protein (Tim44 family)